VRRGGLQVFAGLGDPLLRLSTVEQTAQLIKVRRRLAASSASLTYPPYLRRRRSAIPLSSICRCE
jgi:hypothetical protein